MSKVAYDALDAWVDAHFDEEIAFLAELVKVPTDTPPGDNAPHAERTAQLLQAFGFDAEKHPVPADEVSAYGLKSITNLIVRRRYGAAGQGDHVGDGSEGGVCVALNAHGDVVPPGGGWTVPPYGAVVRDGKLYGRAAAVSKSDFATYAFAVRALEAAAGDDLQGSVELHFTYDEEFGGEKGPGWLLARGLTRPDYAIAAGFSYAIVTAHNGCLQFEVTVDGRMAHAAIPESGVDALQASVRILRALYDCNRRYRQVSSSVPGITHPYLNVGTISGGTNTNVVPGRVVFRIDRRCIPEEDPAVVEAEIRAVIAAAAAAPAERDDPVAAAGSGAPEAANGKLNGRVTEEAIDGVKDGVKVHVRRILLAKPLKPRPGNRPLVEALQRHAHAVLGEDIPCLGTPLYADARLYGEAGVPTVMYGAGPRTVLESNAKRADENVLLEDLRRATKVIARTLLDLLRKD
jgi:acetylornithine deacetylase/succinyl-diaminopimelate desuccinylase-like protein